MFRFKKSYAISPLIALVVGGISALISMSGMKAFSSLKMPPLSPPPWLFIVVWTLLYIMMGLAAAFVYEKGLERSSNALKVYAAQLVLNFLWSIFFFALGMRGFAAVIILLLLIAVIVTAVMFYRIDKRAGCLMIPYALWVAFATYLNFATWVLNK